MLVAPLHGGHRVTPELEDELYELIGPVLHDYQKVGVEFLQAHDRAGLWLDMGLGKTATVLRALTPAHLPVLVTAPRRVATEVWPEEVPKWRSDLTIELAGGSPARRERVLKESTADIVVITRDVLSDAVDYRQRFKTFIVDESSGFKNKRSVRWRAANKIAKVAEHTWILTGTPSPNGLMDVWAQMFLLDQGQRLDTSLGRFRQRYFRIKRQMPNGIVTEWEIKEHGEAAIYSKIEDIVLSMKSEGRITLPEFTVVKEKVALPKHAERIYNDLAQDLVANLQTIGGEIHTALNAAVLSAKLSQVTAGFLYHDDQEFRENDDKYDHIHTAKLDRLAELYEEIDSPLLVAYRFRAERDAILKRFPEAQTADHPGVQKRWNNDEIPMLVVHPASAGHGLNLQNGSGHHMVWTSMTWNLEEWEQFNKRMHRQGQKKAVVCHLLYSPATVDTAIYSRVVEKKSVQDALMGYLDKAVRA
jgi:SNF2 family DNA or RNA helicase